MRYLAIDYGIKRTGLAICDRSEILASPFKVIQADKNTLIKKIKEIIDSEHVDAIVLGLPLNMDDSKGRQAKIVEQFAEQLRKKLDIPLYFQDERLSTFAAEEKIAPAELTTKKKKKRLDAVAAAQILETFLEQKNS